jgi:lipopolysaccharide/colanic/teichoic acid biosynthesis glycosyltransferase
MPATAPRLARRTLDIIASSIGLLVLGLPLLGVMAAIRLTSRGPAIFRQVRIGEGGQPFVMYKLRSMRMNTLGPEVTAVDDPRVTRIGRLLRRSSIDELPELWNVLRGDMTLVGPRPETAALAERYAPQFQWVLQHRPGLTGPAQVRMRDADVLGPGTVVDEAAYLSKLVPARVAVDATFIERPTLRATLAVIVETLRYVLGSPTKQVDSLVDGTAR